MNGHHSRAEPDKPGTGKDGHRGVAAKYPMYVKARISAGGDPSVRRWHTSFSFLDLAVVGDEVGRLTGDDPDDPALRLVHAGFCWAGELEDRTVSPEQAAAAVARFEELLPRMGKTWDAGWKWREIADIAKHLVQLARLATEARRPLVFSSFSASPPDGLPTNRESLVGDDGHAYSDESRVYEHSVRMLLSMWDMGPEERREWHLRQAREAQEWKGAFTKEREDIEKRLSLLFEFPTSERYDRDDARGERHTKDAAECSQLQGLHEGQRLGSQDDAQAIRRCRENRDVGEILAHMETQLLAKMWGALAVTAERALARGEPHHGDAQWVVYETVVKERMIDWKGRVSAFHARSAGQEP